MASLTEPDRLNEMPGSRLGQLAGYLAQDPTNRTLLAELADLRLQSAQWQPAKDCLERLLALTPDDARARYQLAVAERRLGNIEIAQRLLENLLAEGHPQPAVRQELARCLAQQAQWRPVIDCLAPLAPAELEAEQGDLIWLLRIRALHYLGDIEAALAEAAAWLAAREGRLLGQGRAAVATLYLDAEQFEGLTALISGVQADELHDSPELATAAGYLELSQGQALTAHDLFSRSVAAQPTLGRAQLGLGLTAAGQDRLPEAELALIKAVRVAPTHLGNWHALAWVRIFRDDLAGADASLRAALDIDANFGETHGGLALIAALRGDRQEGDRRLRTAVRLNPRSLSAAVAKVVLDRDIRRLDADVLGVAMKRLGGRGATFQRMLATMLEPDKRRV